MSERVSKTVGTALKAVKSIWGWTQERLWPVYTTAVVISLFQMIAIASEKQTLADHFYGDADHQLEKDMGSLVKDGKQYFNEEVALAVKEKVWQMPDNAFRREYANRHGALA